jgi:hypothetical protein
MRNAFTKARKHFITHNIDPVAYITALFDYAQQKRDTLARQHPTWKKSDFRSRKLWRPWPVLIGSPLYDQIYRRWCQTTHETEPIILDHAHTDYREQQKTHDHKIFDQVRRTAELVSEFPRLYPRLPVEHVLRIIFTELSPHYLFFMPESRELIKQGWGSQGQRDVFRALQENAMLFDRYQRLYDSLVQASS